MFTVGEYSFLRVVESHMKMYKTYGPIVHECLGDMHFVRLFDPQVRNDIMTNILTLTTGRIQCEVLTTLPFCFSWIKKFLGQQSKI